MRLVINKDVLPGAIIDNDKFTNKARVWIEMLESVICHFKLRRPTCRKYVERTNTLRTAKQFVKVDYFTFSSSAYYLSTLAYEIIK